MLVLAKSNADRVKVDPLQAFHGRKHRTHVRRNEPRDQLFLFNMAFVSFLSCQLPSLSVWHLSQLSSADTLHCNKRLPRDLSSLQTRQRVRSHHCMSCRAITDDSKGNRRSSLLRCALPCIANK